MYSATTRYEYRQAAIKRGKRIATYNNLVRLIDGKLPGMVTFLEITCTALAFYTGYWFLSAFL